MMEKQWTAAGDGGSLDEESDPTAFHADYFNVMDSTSDELRLPVKSRSVASFGSVSSASDENAHRQRSLPIRRQDTTSKSTSKYANSIGLVVLL